MKSDNAGRVLGLMVLIVLGCFSVTLAWAQQSQGVSPSASSAKAQVTGASSLPASALIQPGEFAAALKTTTASRPLIIHIGCDGRICARYNGKIDILHVEQELKPLLKTQPCAGKKPGI